MTVRLGVAGAAGGIIRPSAYAYLNIAVDRPDGTSAAAAAAAAAAAEVAPMEAEAEAKSSAATDRVSGA